MSRKGDCDLTTRLRALAAFSEVFAAPDFSAGTWKGGQETEDGAIQMPWFHYSREVLAFERMASEMDWLHPFDWMEWSKSDEAKRLHGDPVAVADATPEQLQRLITMVFRLDRFCEGAVDDAIQRGTIPAAARRAGKLLEEMNGG